MTETELEDILRAIELYEPHVIKEIAFEYVSLCHGNYSQEGFLGFLKDKLEIEVTGRISG